MIAEKTCPVCKGRGWNTIAYIREDPRRTCICGRCGGSGYVYETAGRLKGAGDE
jgi:DnaJ-class molecular chaperone